MGRKIPKDKVQPSETSVELHRARFIDWAPSAVVSIAPTADGKLVAVAREDGSIEVYDAASDWNCLLICPGSEDAAISTLVWCHFPSHGAEDGEAGYSQFRLFSSGLDAFIREWDLNLRKPHCSTDSYGGPVWKIAVEPKPTGSEQRMAAACDDGTLRLYTVESLAEGGKPGVHYRRAMGGGTKSRMLSVAWTALGECVLSGSANGKVHLWDAATGRELWRITAAGGVGGGGLQEKSDLCVWALLALTDGTVVSGDSSGAVKFWDGQHGTLLSSANQHQADVLALASNSAGDRVFASGVDSQVVLFSKVTDQEATEEDEGTIRWVFTDLKRPHSHDVRALAVAPVLAEDGKVNSEVLLSGGVDAQVLAYVAPRFTQLHPVRVVKWPQLPRLHVCPPPPSGCKSSGPLLLAQHPQWIDIWALGSQQPQPSQEDTPMGTITPTAPIHSVRVRLRRGAQVLCSALSSDGCTLAASDAVSTRLFRLKHHNDNSLVEVTPLPHSLPAASQLGFNSLDSLLLVPIGTSQRTPGENHCSSLMRVQGVSGAGDDVSDGEEEEPVASSVLTKSYLAGPKSKGSKFKRVGQDLAPGVRGSAVLAISTDGRWAAVSHGPSILPEERGKESGSHSGGGGGATVELHCLESDDPAALLVVPQDADAASPSPVTALAFSPKGDMLVAATASNALHVFDTATRSLSQWSLGLPRQPRQLADMPGHVSGVSFPAGASSSSRVLPCIVHTPGGCTFVDLTRSPTPATAPEDEQTQDPSLSTSGEGGEKKRKRGREPPKPPAQAHPTHSALHSQGGIRLEPHGSPDSVFRRGDFEDACAGMMYLPGEGKETGGKVLLAECPWAKVLKTFPAPFYKHRYGS